MKIGTLRKAGLVLALGLAGPALGQAVEPGAGAPVATAPQAAPAAPATYRDVIRLHEAGLSDDFILRKLGREGFVYRLSTDDIIACKAAGLPEPIIEAMLKTAAGTEPEARVPPRPAPETVPPVAPGPAPPAVSPAPPVVPATPPATPVEASVGQAAPAAPAAAATPSAASPAASPAVPVAVPAVVPLAPPPQAAAAPNMARQAERTWEGMVRRAPGVVLFRPPWEPGRVSFRGERLVWLDAADEGKNLALPASEIREHFLVCPKDSESDGDCFEWGVKTADGEVRFRDAAWEKARSARPLELFEFLRSTYPDLPTARYRAKKR